MPFAAGSARDIPVRALKLCGLTWSGECLWFSEAVSNQIMALSPSTGEVVRRIPCAQVRTDLTTMGGNLVQVAGDPAVMRVIDPESGEVVDELPNPRPGHQLTGLEATWHGIWLGYSDLRVIELYSAQDFTPLDLYPVRHGIAGVTVSDDFLAYADYQDAKINLIDLRQRREVASISVHGNPKGIAWDGNHIWYCDHTTLQLRAIEVPGIAAG